MIKLKILSSPDQTLSKEHQFFFEQITIGNLRDNCILNIFDPKWPNQQILHLIPQDNGVISELKSTRQENYLSNGKKIKGRKLHKQEDQIQVGDSIIEIIHWELQPKEMSFSDRYKEASQDPVKAKSLEKLESEILFLEQKINAQK
jgi:hypothetical protein